MNLAILGINGLTAQNDCHPDLNRELNFSNKRLTLYGGGRRPPDDSRWHFGASPKGKADFGQLHHKVRLFAPAFVPISILLTNVGSGCASVADKQTDRGRCT